MPLLINLRIVTFRSLSASASATLARVLPFISFSSPLACLPTTPNSKPERKATFHPPQFAALHSVTTFVFPVPISDALRSVHPLKPKPTKALPPFNGEVKNKGSFAHGLMLAASSSHSFNRSVRPHYTISFVRLTNFSTARVSISCLNTYTYPHPRQQHSRLFLPANCLPYKTGSRSLSLCSACIGHFIMLLK